jgi:hypothetical protein
MRRTRRSSIFERATLPVLRYSWCRGARLDGLAR